jgi:hypothetical protein
VAAANFTLVQSGVTGAGSIAVSGSGTTYIVSASSGSGSGTLGLNLSSAGSIKDSSNRGLQGAPYTGPVYTLDRTAPTVSSINRAASTPTNAASVAWTVTLSEPVTGVDAGDFGLAASGLTATSISSVTGSGASYTVTAGSGTGSGSLGLNLNDNDSIVDAAGNKLGGSGTGTVTSGGNGNGSFAGQTYTVDKIPPPAPAIAGGPTGTGNPSSATFGFTDAEDPSVTYLCKLDSAAYTACANPATYSGLSDGSHTFAVEAKDAAGNVSGPSATRTWSVDATPPPRPSVTNGPNNKWDSSTVTFSFTDSETGVSFQCNIDLSSNPGWQACTSPKTYFNMASGTHEFDVRAVDAAGNVSDYNGWKWSETGLVGSGQSFTISGSASDTLSPGGTIATLNLSLTNPNSVPIYVNSLTVAFGSVNGPNVNPPSRPCGSLDYQIGQIGVALSPASPLTLPANSTRTLRQLGLTQAQLPTIRMLDRPVNQNGCKSATVTLNYTGSAQS